MFSLPPPTAHLTRYLSLPTRGHTRLLTVQPTSPSPFRNDTNASTLPPRPPKNWLTNKVENSSAVKDAFVAFTKIIGYGSARQVAGRRAFAIYKNCCIVRADEDKHFWQDGTHVFNRVNGPL